MAYSRAEREALIQRYEEGPGKLRAAYARVPKEAVQWRPAEGKWSAHEVVVHCGDSETIASMRIRFLLAENKPVIAGYDEAHWARLLDYHTLPLEPAFAAVEATRANTAALLRTLPEQAWHSEGTHSATGRYTAEDWLRIYAEHVEKHSRQIDRNVEAWKARPAQP